MQKLLSLILSGVLFLSLTQSVRAESFDLKPLAVRQILSLYNSPMLGYEADLVRIAEKYNLDWTLLVAIAGTESSFGKRMPANCLNPYGWGIYGDHKLCYSTYPEAAEAVARGITSSYNTTSLETIAYTYNQANTAGWISHTRYFINKIKTANIPVSHLPITL